MLNSQTVIDVVILTPDVVRMNARREQIVQDFVNSRAGENCKAFGVKNADGFTSIELWGGDTVQRQAFKQALETELHH